MKYCTFTIKTGSFAKKTANEVLQLYKNGRSGNADVYLHEIPGGQYTNLQFQAYR